MKELLFIDVETTGHDPSDSKDAIVEVAVALFDLKAMEVVDSFESLVAPVPGGHQTVLAASGWEWDLGDFHKKGGHFKDADWSQARPLEDVLLELTTNWLPNSTLAGQNPTFDLTHIQRDCGECGISFPKIDYHRVDLVSSAAFLWLYDEVEGLSLRHTLQWANEIQRGVRKWVQKHRAMSDVLDEIEVFRAMAMVFGVGLKSVYR